MTQTYAHTHTNAPHAHAGHTHSGTVFQLVNFIYMFHNGDVIFKSFSWGSLKDDCIYGYPSLWWLNFPYVNFVEHDCHSIKVWI